MKQDFFVALAYSTALSIAKLIKTGANEQSIIDDYTFTQSTMHHVPKRRKSEFADLVKDIYFEKVKPLIE